MKNICGIWWPDDTPDSAVKHALVHVESVEFAISHCPRHRTVVQAGGNIGLWPKRLAQKFARVITFEPDGPSRDCLVMNVPQRVEVHAAALGATVGRCGLSHKGLGSHKTVEGGDEIEMVTIDSLGLDDVDFIQLDIEGYEWHALVGAAETLKRCRPLVQVELRQMTEHYGQVGMPIRQFLWKRGYRLISQQPGRDFVFEAQR